MMQLFKPSLIVSTLIICAMAQAEIYKSTDSYGNITYTDRPEKNAKPVGVRSTNSIPAVEVQKIDQSDADPALANAKGAVKYRFVRIIDPADDSGIEHGPGNFTVRASSKPKLAEDHALQLYLDGEAYGKANSSGSFALRNIDRGTHTLTVSVVDAAGKALKRSKPITVHVFRPSVLQPGLSGR